MVSNRGFKDQETGIQPMDNDDNGYLGVSKVGIYGVIQMTIEIVNINFWLVVTGTMEFYDFPYIGNVIIPTDELIFFRGVGIPPTRYPLNITKLSILIGKIGKMMIGQGISGYLIFTNLIFKVVQFPGYKWVIIPRTSSMYHL